MQPIKFYNIIQFFFIAFTILIAGCINDAEHDNPFDPKSNKYQGESSIMGEVYTYYPPYQALANAEILIIPGHYWTTSNQAGEFTIANLPANEYTICVSLSGYAPDSVKINLNPAVTEGLLFNLNGLPQLQNYNINAGHISRWWPYDLYLIKISAKVADLDGSGDVSQVRIYLPAFNFSDSLNRTIEPEIFNALFYKDQFPITSLHQVLGHPFFLQVEDKPGASCESPPIYIARIIEETPILISPQGLEIVDSQPLLKWQQLTLSFPFSYQVEVTRVDEQFKTIVWSIDGVNSDSTSIQVTQALTTGTYFWTLAAIDDFGNWSRSKEAPFLVE